MRAPKGSTLPTFLYYYYEKRAGMHFRSKDFTRADIAQLPVAHAYNVLPNRAFSGHVTNVTFGHVTSGHVTSGCSPLLHRKYGFVTYSCQTTGWMIYD